MQGATRRFSYDLDSIGHNPHELASYLTALLQTYTPQSAQAELNRVFAMQSTLTLTEETEIRYRTETSTDPETGETTSEEVPCLLYTSLLTAGVLSNLRKVTSYAAKHEARFMKLLIEQNEDGGKDVYKRQESSCC